MVRTPNDHSGSYDHLYTQPEIGSVSLCNLMFIAIFADDEMYS